LLADSTKAKIRSLLSVLFNHAIRYEWFDQGRNPITLVRQSAKRQRTPEVLETVEIQRLVRTQFMLSPDGDSGCDNGIAP
jgi:site-specific recombinase XerD